MARDLLTLLDRAPDELARLIGATRSLTTAFDERAVKTLPGRRRVGVLWDGRGMRNRAALDLAIAALEIDHADVRSSLDGPETIEDIALYLDLWLDCVVVRSPRHEDVARLAASAVAPVANAGTAYSHPCELLCDLAYLDEVGILSKEPTIVFVGPATNMLLSLLEASALLPITVLQIGPSDLHATDAPSGARWTATDDLEAIASADVVYTDCWWPARLAPNDHDLRRRLDTYRLTTPLVARARPGTPILHGPPVTVGLEIDADVVASYAYKLPDAKRHLLGATAAVLTDLLV